MARSEKSGNCFLYDGGVGVELGLLEVGRGAQGMSDDR